MKTILYGILLVYVDYVDGLVSFDIYNELLKDALMYH